MSGFGSQSHEGKREAIQPTCIERSNLISQRHYIFSASLRVSISRYLGEPPTKLRVAAYELKRRRQTGDSLEEITDFM